MYTRVLALRSMHVDEWRCQRTETRVVGMYVESRKLFANKRVTNQHKIQKLEKLLLWNLQKSVLGYIVQTYGFSHVFL
jgi:hypothetical protein